MRINVRRWIREDGSSYIRVHSCDLDRDIKARTVDVYLHDGHWTTTLYEANKEDLQVIIDLLQEVNETLWKED